MAESIRAKQRGTTRFSDFKEYLAEKPSDFEVEWGASSSEVVEKFFGDIKSDIDNVLESISGFIDYLTSVIEVVENILEIVAISLGFAVDIFQALVLTIKEVLESFINLFTSVSINTLYHFPTSYKNRRRPNEILYDIGTAYNDTSDPNRPITVQETTFGACAVVMWSLPNLEALLDQLGHIKKIFGGFSNLFDFQDIVNNVETRFSLKNEMFGVSAASLLRPIVGHAPNFEGNFSLTDFGPILNLIDGTADLILLIEKGSAVSDRLREIVRILRNRINAVSTLSTRILQSFAAMIELLVFAEGQNIFACYGNGTSSDFAKAIINAPLHPEYPRSDFSEPDFNNDNIQDTELAQSMMYSGAFLIHLGSPDRLADTEKILNLFKLFVGVANVQNISTSVEEAGIELGQG